MHLPVAWKGNLQGLQLSHILQIIPPLVFFILHLEGQDCVLPAPLLRYCSSMSGLLLWWLDIELASGPIFVVL